MTKVGLAFHRTFHSVSHSRNFRLFFVGQAVSVTGTWMQSMALAWLVLRLTDSGVALGVQMALNFGPVLFLGAHGGLLADRHDKRKILISTQAAFAVLALALWALVAFDVVNVWHVYGLSLLQGIVTAADMPARQSFYAEMVGEDDLTNAVSLNSAIITGTRIVGPALAAALIATIGVASCFLLNAVSYLALIGGLMAMRPEEFHGTGQVDLGKGQVREGLRYVWRTPGLRLPLVWMAIIFTFSFNFSILLLLLAERTFHGDAGTYGMMLAVMGLGSMLGALAVARQQCPNPRRVAAAATGFGLISVGAAAAPTLGWVVAALVPVGAISMVFMITGNSTLQLTSRPEMRGRVMALYGIAFLGVAPVGGPLAGWLADRFGTRLSIGFGGFVAALTGLVGLWTLARRRREVAREPLPGPSDTAVGVPVGASASNGTDQLRA
ncbi:MAG: MFS transporter [Actinomycetota bacterium]